VGNVTDRLIRDGIQILFPGSGAAHRPDHILRDFLRRVNLRSPRNRTRFIVLDKGHEVKGNARKAITDYYVIREYRDFSYVRLSPHTGRTHQLRVHLSHAGNPILGDRVYGKASSFERLALHAYSIEFTHPITGLTMVSYSPFPPLFREFLKHAAPHGVGFRL